jgi:hypothetical protein
MANLKWHKRDVAQTNNATTSTAKKRRIIIHDSSSDDDEHQPARAAANKTSYCGAAISAEDIQPHLMNIHPEVTEENSTSSDGRVVLRTIHTETVTEA